MKPNLSASGFGADLVLDSIVRIAIYIKTIGGNLS